MKPRSNEIRYNDRLTVEENADRNGVSVATIRRYIRTNSIDRRYDRKVSIIEEGRRYIESHPSATKTEIAKETGHSLTTIRMYWPYISTEKELTVFDNNKSKKRQLRQSNNFYATHPSVTQDLLRVEAFNNAILEPFCGSGSMARVLQSNGYEVSSYDIINRGFGKQGDFLTTDFEEGHYDIITNPPYDSHLSDYIRKCLKICKSKVALLLPIRYLSSVTRLNEIYSKTPPARVYIYSQRITIAKNADFERYSRSSNTEIYAWIIWDKTYQGETILRWLLNNPV